MRGFWKIGQVVSLKLAENIYTLCQMSEQKQIMAFFDIFRDQDDWHGIDLSQEKIIMVVRQVAIIQAFGERKITPKEVKPLEKIEIPDKYWVAHLNEIENFHKGEFYLKGGCLFQEVENQDSIRLKNDLDAIKDREDILQYQMETLYTPQHIQTRLLFNYKYQKDFDYFKHKIFPNLYEEKMFQQFLEMEKEFGIKLSSEANQ